MNNNKMTPSTVSETVRKERVRKALIGEIDPRNLYKEERDRYDEIVRRKRKREERRERRRQEREQENEKKRALREVRQKARRTFECIASEEVVRTYLTDAEIAEARKRHEKAIRGCALELIRTRSAEVWCKLNLEAKARKQDAERVEAERKAQAERDAKAMALAKNACRIADEVLVDQLLTLVSDDLERLAYTAGVSEIKNAVRLIPVETLVREIGVEDGADEIVAEQIVGKLEGVVFDLAELIETFCNAEPVRKERESEAFTRFADLQETFIDAPIRLIEEFNILDPKQAFHKELNGLDDRWIKRALYLFKQTEGSREERFEKVLDKVDAEYTLETRRKRLRM